MNASASRAAPKRATRSGPLTPSVRELRRTLLRAGRSIPLCDIASWSPPEQLAAMRWAEWAAQRIEVPLCVLRITGEAVWQAEGKRCIFPHGLPCLVHRGVLTQALEACRVCMPHVKEASLLMQATDEIAAASFGRKQQWSTDWIAHLLDAATSAAAALALVPPSALPVEVRKEAKRCATRIEELIELLRPLSDDPGVTMRRILNVVEDLGISRESLGVSTWSNPSPGSPQEPTQLRAALDELGRLESVAKGEQSRESVAKGEQSRESVAKGGQSRESVARAFPSTLEGSSG